MCTGRESVGCEERFSWSTGLICCQYERERGSARLFPPGAYDLACSFCLRLCMMGIQEGRLGEMGSWVLEHAR